MMKKGLFKSGVAILASLSLVLSFAPLSNAAGLGETDITGGSGDINYVSNEVICIAVPTSLDFAVNPQGIVAGDEGNEFDEEAVGTVSSDTYAIVNFSSKNIKCTMGLFVDPDSGVTLSTDDVKELDDETTTLSLNIVPVKDTSNIDVSGAEDKIPEANDETLYGYIDTESVVDADFAELSVPVMSTSSAAPSKFAFELGKAEYQINSDGTAYEIQDEASGGIFAFKFDGTCNSNGDWSALKEGGFDITAKFNFEKVLTLKGDDVDSVPGLLSYESADPNDPGLVFAKAAKATYTIPKVRTADILVPLNFGKGKGDLLPEGHGAINSIKVEYTTGTATTWTDISSKLTGSAMFKDTNDNYFFKIPAAAAPTAAFTTSHLKVTVVYKTTPTGSATGTKIFTDTGAPVVAGAVTFGTAPVFDITIA